MSQKRIKILAICGSTRRESSNLTLLRTIQRSNESRFDLNIYQKIDQLPHFNPDIEKVEIPPTVVEFRTLIQTADAVLFCTPEYVFALPGSLKNAIDWTVSSIVFSDKPVGIITASTLGIKAHESLQLIMEKVYSKVSPATCLLISGIKTVMNSKGEITDPAVKDKIDRLLDELLAISK